MENKNKTIVRDDMSRIELSEWEESLKVTSGILPTHTAKVGMSKDSTVGKIGKDGKVIREGGPSGRIFRVVAMEPMDVDGEGDSTRPQDPFHPFHQQTPRDRMSHSTFNGTVSTGRMSAPMLTRYIDLAYSTIVSAVRKIHSEALATLDVRYTARPVPVSVPVPALSSSSFASSTSSTALSSMLSSSSSSSAATATSSFNSSAHTSLGMAPTFGLTATQFFGIGLPFARHAIEMVPESCAALLFPSPVPQYRPSYRLPSKVLWSCSAPDLLANT